MRVAIQGDIGQPVYHVGDEAMVHAAVEQFGRRGLHDVVLLTRDPAHTRAHFGAGTNVARTLVFPWEPGDRERYLNEIKAVMAGERSALPPDDQVFDVIETIRGVDALFLAGGGNLNSRYGWLLHERAATVHIAIALGKQVVLGGQTLGPELSPADRGTLANLLDNAALVGLREDSSLALARELSPNHRGLVPCLDDAVELPTPPGGAAAPSLPRIAATFAGPLDPDERADAARAYARIVDAAAARLSLPVLFLPHMATPGLGDFDEAFHAEIAAHLVDADAELAPIASALETAAVTRRCRAVLTSRYHPVVFACSMGLPSVAVAADEYTRVRISGAYRRFGSSRVARPLADLLAGDEVPSAWISPLDRTPTPAPVLETQHARWWDEVVAELASPRGRSAKLARHWLRSRRHDARRLLRRLG